MPTTRRRHVLTETDELAAALDEAAAHWPEHRGSRSTLLRDLVVEGHRALVARRVTARLDWAARVDATAGALTGVYRSDEVERLREDWPE